MEDQTNTRTGDPHATFMLSARPARHKVWATFRPRQGTI